jgi:hypothetical protein
MNGNVEKKENMNYKFHNISLDLYYNIIVFTRKMRKCSSSKPPPSSSGRVRGPSDPYTNNEDTKVYTIR